MGDIVCLHETVNAAGILQSVLDSMDQGVVVADSQGRVLLCNPAADRIARVPLSRLPLREWIEHLELFQADGITPFPPHELPLARALRGEETPELLMCLRGPHHPEPTLVSIKGRPLSDPQGRPWGGVAVFRDVTREHQAETALRESAQQIEDMYNHAPCGYHSLDAHGTFVMVNDTELSWLGYRREELVGRRKFVDLLTPRSVETFRRNFPLFLERGWVRDLEFEILRRDGSILDALVNATAIRDRQGRFVMSRSTLIDNTERKRAERCLAARHAVIRILAESRSLAESMPEVLEALGIHLGWEVVALWGVERRTGRPRLTASWISPLWNLSMSRDQEPGLPRIAHETVALVFGQGQATCLSLLEPRGGGEDPEAALLTSACVQPIFIRGEVLAVLGLFSPTPREPDDLLTAMLGGLAEQLGQFIEGRQMQERMIQSERLASIGLLSAGVAHEINNPLAYVANNLAVLDRDFRQLLDLASAAVAALPVIEASDSVRSRTIRRIVEELDFCELQQRLGPLLASTRQGVERVASTVRHLRGFARLDQAAIDRIQLKDSVASTIGLLESRLARAGVRLDLRMDDLPPVECAPAQINQVLLNLLTNAVQAIESAGRDQGKIEIIGTSDEGEVSLEVIDNGCGIAPEVVGRIFDPFYTTKAIGQGSGLGLSICHGIITEHGGRIEVESRIGEGSRFRVVLPVSRSPR